LSLYTSQIANVPGRQVKVHFFWNELDSYGTGVLGGSESPVHGDGTTAWTYSEHVWRDGANYDGPWDGWDTLLVYDVTAAGSFGWSFGPDPTGLLEVDFRSVVAHEIGHSIGFYGTYDPTDDLWGHAAGTTVDPNGDAGFQGLTRWDQNLVDGDGDRAANGSDGTPGDFSETGSVYWDGVNALAEYGSMVPIYAPSSFADGSSLVHIDEDTFSTALMTPGTGLGWLTDIIREPNDLEWAMMRDMGWQVGAAVPEPSSIVALVGMGFIGIIGYVRRQRRRP